jgi:LysR family glycine cleavage system transcriptional activator
LASRLYRFTSVCPEVDVRVSSSLSNANFTTDGVDVAIRSLPSNAAANSALVIEKLIEMSLVPVCSPRLVEMHGPLEQPEALKGVPLIHDDTLAAGETTNWADWFKAAGVSSVDVSRGLRFNSADHALDAASEGAGVLLARDVLAYDDLRMGRLVIPIEFAMRSGRAYYFAHVQAFRSWIKQEVAALDWKQVKGGAGCARGCRLREELQHSPGLQMSSKRSSCSRDPPEKTNPVSLKIPFDS